MMCLTFGRKQLTLWLMTWIQKAAFGLNLSWTQKLWDKISDKTPRHSKTQNVKNISKTFHFFCTKLIETSSLSWQSAQLAQHPVSFASFSELRVNVSGVRARKFPRPSAISKRRAFEHIKTSLISMISMIDSMIDSMISMISMVGGSGGMICNSLTVQWLPFKINLQRALSLNIVFFCLLKSEHIKSTQCECSHRGCT